MPKVPFWEKAGLLNDWDQRLGIRENKKARPKPRLSSSSLCDSVSLW